MNIKRSSVRLNFFDIFLIVLTLLIISGAVVLLTARSSGTAADKTVVEYTVLVKELPADLVVHAKPGDTIIDTIKLGTIGTLVSFHSEPAQYEHYNQVEGVLNQGTYEDLVSISFTIRAEAEYTDDAYRIGGIRIAHGAQIYFRTPFFTGFGFITDVNPVGAQ